MKIKPQDYLSQQEQQEKNGENLKIQEQNSNPEQYIDNINIFNPQFLQKHFEDIVPTLIEKPSNRKKHKGTNIPKFLLKVFFNNIPNFPDPKHTQRLDQFLRRPEKSKTRFHLVQLFGTTVTDSRMDQQNQLNRRVLKRLLNRNYDNILTNKHIRNKRLYLMFCKKMMLRLNKPQLIDRLQI